MLEFLTDNLRQALLNVNMNSVYELRVRASKPVVVNYGGEYTFLGAKGITPHIGSALIASYSDIETIIYRASEYSVYTVNDRLRRGFLTGAGGERIGLAGSFVYENGNTFTIKEVTSLNIRVPHEVRGCGEVIYRTCFRRELKSALILSPPGRGKTTILRDLTRLISAHRFLNVLINDERNEIAAADRDFSLDTGRVQRRHPLYGQARRAHGRRARHAPRSHRDGRTRQRRGAGSRRRLRAQRGGSARLRAFQGYRKHVCVAALCPRPPRTDIRLLYPPVPRGDRPGGGHLRGRPFSGGGMLKFLLCVLALGGCMAAAYLFTRKYKLRRAFFYDLDLFNERLVNEVSYTRVPAPRLRGKVYVRRRFQKDARRQKRGFRQGKLLSFLT